MRKTCVCGFVTAMLACFVLLAGCSEQSAEEEILWDAKPSVMIDGVLYGDTGRAATYRTDERPDRGGRVDGDITSSVERHEYPEEDDQSNFGAGYPYRFGGDGRVEVFFDSADNWIIFEAYEDQN